jgi:hypothetical protein
MEKFVGKLEIVEVEAGGFKCKVNMVFGLF